MSMVTEILIRCIPAKTHWPKNFSNFNSSGGMVRVVAISVFHIPMHYCSQCKRKALQTIENLMKVINIPWPISLLLIPPPLPISPVAYCGNYKTSERQIIHYIVVVVSAICEHCFIHTDLYTSQVPGGSLKVAVKWVNKPQLIWWKCFPDDSLEWLLSETQH